MWREHKTVDLACGSGTLLAATLTEMKRRAREQGANETQIADLQRLAVEDTVKRLDINPISLQLAASQLTAGNHEIRYRNIGLELMPYGPKKDDPTRVSVGTLELLGQSAIVPRNKQMDLGDDKIGSQTIWNQHDDAELENAVDAVKDAQIVIMNPPFTNRAKMGEKFPEEIQQALRSRVDQLENQLLKDAPDFENLASQNSVAPSFVMLADHCLPSTSGIMTMINPTIALSGTSGLQERQTLAQRFHVHTVLTCHQPGNSNLSQDAGIQESIILLLRCEGAKQPTRFINLDRLPVDGVETDEMFQAIAQCQTGMIPGGWGEVSHWPVERMEGGDWTAAIWRSHELAQAAYAYASHEYMQRIEQANIYQSGRRVSEFCKEARANDEGSIALLHSKGADGQRKIAGKPDKYYKPQDPASPKCLQGVKNLKARAGHLLITDGQNSSTARLTAVASDTKYVGVGWMPVIRHSQEESKAIAVFLNSTPGRLQLMRNAGRTIAFPMYRPAAYANIRIPNINDSRVRQILADCWNQTKDMEVPQFRDGECEVRRLWDEAVAEAMGWDADELAQLRNLLHQEPHVRGLGYNEYGNELDEIEEEEYFEE